MKKGKLTELVLYTFLMIPCLSCKQDFPPPMYDDSVSEPENSSCVLPPVFDLVPDFPIKENEAILRGMLLSSKKTEGRLFNLQFGVLDQIMSGESFLRDHIKGDIVTIAATCPFVAPEAMTVLIKLNLDGSYYLVGTLES